MDKKRYTEPEIEVNRFEFPDIITTSGGDTDEDWGGAGGGIELPDDEW